VKIDATLSGIGVEVRRFVSKPDCHGVPPRLCDAVKQISPSANSAAGVLCIVAPRAAPGNGCGLKFI
jgi:hypothetical protein